MMRQGQYSAACLTYMRMPGLTDANGAPEGAGVSPFLAGSSEIRVSGESAVARDESVVLVQSGRQVQVTGGSMELSDSSTLSVGGSSISVAGGSLQFNDDAVLTFAESSTIQVCRCPSWSGRCTLRSDRVLWRGHRAP